MRFNLTMNQCPVKFRNNCIHHQCRITMKILSHILLGAFLMLYSGIKAQVVYHVVKTGSDSNTGTMASPFLTFSKAARTLRAGGAVIIHGGTYREYVNPPNDGTSDASRVTFKAAMGENVYVKGSEIISKILKILEIILSAIIWFTGAGNMGSPARRV